LRNIDIVNLISQQLASTGLWNNCQSYESMSNIEVVDFASLVADSAKLKYLEKVKQNDSGNEGIQMKYP